MKDLPGSHRVSRYGDARHMPPARCPAGGARGRDVSSPPPGGPLSAFHFDFKEAPKNVRLRRGDMRRIWGYLLPAWGPTALILVCIVTSALLGLLPPLLIRELIDRAIPRHDGRLLDLLVAGMIGAPVLASLIGVWQSYLATLMGQDVM